MRCSQGQEEGEQQKEIGNCNQPPPLRLLRRRRLRRRRLRRHRHIFCQPLFDGPASSYSQAIGASRVSRGEHNVSLAEVLFEKRGGGLKKVCGVTWWVEVESNPFFFLRFLLLFLRFFSFFSFFPPLSQNKKKKKKKHALAHSPRPLLSPRGSGSNCCPRFLSFVVISLFFFYLRHGGSARREEASPTGAQPRTEGRRGARARGAAPPPPSGLPGHRREQARPQRRRAGSRREDAPQGKGQSEARRR